MAARKPIVLINGQLQELPSGDTLNAASSEVDIVAKTNDNASALSAGMAVYVKSNGNVDKAQANASGTKNVLGLVRDASIASAASGYIQTDGVLSAADWTAATGSATLTPGAIYYLSAATAGQITATPPSSSGNYVQALGMAISTTEIDININPSGSVLLA